MRARELLTATSRVLAAVALLAPPAAHAAESRREPTAVIKVAHRGGIEPGFPENTLRAYRRAIALGADVLEIDLQATRDRAVVVIHDDTVDRTTNGRGRVAEFSLQELRRLDAGMGEQIPTLEEALQAVAGSRAKLLLDVKPSPHLGAEAVVRLVEARRQTLDVIVGVRSLSDLQEFRRLNRNLRILAFIDEVQQSEDFIAAGADVIRLWPAWIDAHPDIVRRIQMSNRAVWATSLDDASDALKRLVATGVDGVISDRVTTLSSVLDDLKNEDGNSAQQAVRPQNPTATTHGERASGVEPRNAKAGRR
jgi:glycerophosphoryl diester phosphodiesterase